MFLPIAPPRAVYGPGLIWSVGKAGNPWSRVPFFLATNLQRSFLWIANM